MADVSMARIARRGLGGVFDARGRDDRTQYWLFLALMFGPLVGLQMVAQFVLAMPSFDPGTLAHSDRPLGDLRFLKQQFAGMATVAYAGIGLYLLGALIMLTATARRLHDRGRSGWWALTLPGALFVTGMGHAHRIAEMAEHMPQIFAQMEKAHPGDVDLLSIQAELQASAGGPDWSYIAGGLVLLVLVIELMRAGIPGPNRFGSMAE